MHKFQELSGEKLCIRCLGRVFASVGHTFTNDQRGSNLIFASQCIGEEIFPTVESECVLCEGIFLKIPEYANEISQRLENYEYKTILIGSSFPMEVLEKERLIQEKYGSMGEPIKKEFSRELGKYFVNAYGKEFNRTDPDIMVKVNVEFMSIELQIKSILIYGTYNKLIRGIPQTRWIKYSEKTDTVESLIGEPLKEMGRGKDFVLHGAGREDVDVKMLGNGREFVIELTDPRTRSINLDQLEQIINNAGRGVNVSNLRFSTREEIRKIKNEKYFKVYRAVLETDGKMECNKLKEICGEFNGKVIYQRTPLRVSSSRSDLIRERTVVSMRAECAENGEKVLTIEAEAGTYIKELISGDDGRTRPSLSERMGEDIRISELDVIEIKR